MTGSGPTDAPVVLVVAGDAGGARALAPALERLDGDGRVRLRVLACRSASAVWAERSVPFEEIEEETADPREILASAPALVLTGTSYPPGLELRLIAAARERGIPSAALLDFWSNYAARFRLPAGDGLVLPDQIFVMDEEARAEMLAAGFATGGLRITGQPALGELPAWRGQFSPARRREIREALGAGDRPLVLFVSQPLSQIYGRAGMPELGYDEQSVLGLLADRLQRLAIRRDLRFALVVKPHPRDAPAPLPITDEARVSLQASSRGGRELTMAADLVVGMSSELLVESCALGCVTLSLQPGLRLPDTLPTNRRGLSRAVYDVADVEPALEALLLDDRARASARSRLAAFVPDPQAASRVAEAVLAMTGLGAGSR